MNRKENGWLPIVAALAGAALAFAVTFSFFRGQVDGLKSRLAQSEAARQTILALQSETNPDYDVGKLNEIQTLLDKYFIEDIDRDYMTENLAAGMIAGLHDRWSYYITAEEYDSYLETVNNAYVGIGITILQSEDNDKGFTVQEVTRDSPAYLAGIVPGDIVVAVEGQSVLELGMAETRNLVRGEEGTEVTISVLHGGELLELTIPRASIKKVNVTYELMDGEVGYIHIGNFEGNSADDTIAAIEALRAQGAQSLLFDVRFNPGGYKDEMVAVLDYLLPEGVLFRSENYDGSTEIEYSDESCVELPMAVLINGDSYSAAEFFAAALSEYEAAQTVGTKTSGKGHFQTNFRLSDGSAINISIGRYSTPNDVNLTDVGITPDVTVELTDEEYADIYYGNTEAAEDKQLQAALALLIP